MMEIWVPIKDFEDYEISSWGRVRNKSGSILLPYKNHKGYLKIGLYKDGKSHKKRIHRLVAETFIANPNYLPEVNHKDGNKENNSFTNLEWVTGEENRIHAKIMQDWKDLLEGKYNG